MIRESFLQQLGWLLAAVGLALVLTVLVTLPSGAPPLETIYVLFKGGVGSMSKIGRVLAGWVPLTLCAVGLLVPFTARLWNIGVEGQVVMGAIFCTAALRPFDNGGAMEIALAMGAAMLGGALWALLAGMLRVFGRVHEIFSGLGLNFVALGVTLWLIFGPWKRPGVASMSGTQPLDFSLWLPRLGKLSVSWVSLAVAIAAIFAIYYLLYRSEWGLKLRAVGENPKAATLFSLGPRRRLLQAFMICGAFAGLAGAVQVLGVYHRLLPAISSNYGYTALLVGMMASFRLPLVPFICLFFAILNVGSIQLPLQMGLDSSLSGVIQGIMVLSLFIVQGLRLWLKQRKEAD
ncbi:Inner-membrane translocator [Pseudodesulfovibrio profundus]|uniref:Inner-membrane translocator n=1 Tax=Pseudodesulfovibrio profundus TaxID=57320 RepID=A0A2C8F6R0_9BACT|nr:ABC transporter permease [Pseudodesulfovibrio profundus]MBC16770.1 ABC transporter permease [Desulfovibrio sp.]SOB58186.1 Inner-membrane translocator [Pseudodesulfovibrio profundus]|tara:strand:+ start:5875 stop:6915 length:1041 start_codon:yes stop_codon:yes gene_type:complete